MKLERVAYSSLANLGNYQNERIELVAQIEEGEDWKDVLNELKVKVHGELNFESDYWKAQEKIRAAKREMEEIQTEIDKARQNWEVMSNFMKAQGLKTDTDKFPDLPRIMPADRVIDGEIQGEF